MLSLLLALSAVVAPPGEPSVVSGIDNQIHVDIPRVEAQIVVDGALDETAWGQAAVLTGFSQYSPVDGRPADQRTDVHVWYSSTAIYFGVKAYSEPGSVHATLANRDKIDADDNIQIFLSTFNDGRQAFVFGVNPFGIQSDGALAEGSAQQRSLGATQNVGEREATDLSPDYVYQSKGRLTDYGYEIEIRVPFKSLRYQATEPQRWGISIIRKVQATGHEDSWVPAKRAASSFLAQSGTLEGLRDLHRGLVLDLNPIVTAKIDGLPGDQGWEYDGGRPDFGGNIRWGVTANLTLNGTINPDFSQVEADEGQFAFDPRRALFFAEKRPFFLEGIEQFNTPNQLVYTRRIFAPDFAAKLTGKVSGTNIAVLSAVDGQETSYDGRQHPIVNVMRIQRDIGGQSRAGFVVTDREDGLQFNRVLAGDARLIFRGIYALQLQAGGSMTRADANTVTAPIWEASLQRSGRTFGLRYRITGIHPDFTAGTGFISRPGIVDSNIDHRWTSYGAKGALLESVTHDVEVSGIWQYLNFVRGGVQDKKLHFNENFALRGGWKLRGSAFYESFGYDTELYRNYYIAREAPDGGLRFEPYVGVPTIINDEYVVSVDTPQFSQFTGSFFVLAGHDENFFEWAPAYLVIANASADWRPTEQARVNFGYQFQHFTRRTDGTTVGSRQIPRLKVEYQVTRSIFLRMISQYTMNRQDDLRDDSRTGLPIYFLDSSTGAYTRASAFERNTLRMDWLFSYQPSPGTVIFAGYGRGLADPDSVRSQRLHRVTDGFFLKWSYLFRM